ATFPTIASQVTSAYNTPLKGIQTARAKDTAKAAGSAPAQGLLAKRKKTGSGANGPYTFLPPGPASNKRHPPIASYPVTGPVAPWVKQFKPFTLLSPDQFRVDGPPPLGSVQWAEDFNEVKNFGAASNQPNSRSAEQEEIGLFYGNINAQT